MKKAVLSEYFIEYQLRFRSECPNCAHFVTSDFDLHGQQMPSQLCLAVYGSLHDYFLSIASMCNISLTIKTRRYYGQFALNFPTERACCIGRAHPLPNLFF